VQWNAATEYNVMLSPSVQSRFNAIMTHPSALAGLDQAGQLEHSSISNKE
jgi:hypothetical protein